jgi:hypothetical protein
LNSVGAKKARRNRSKCAAGGEPAHSARNRAGRNSDFGQLLGRNAARRPVGAARRLCQKLIDAPQERTSQLDWVVPKIIKRVIIRPRYVKVSSQIRDFASFLPGGGPKVSGLGLGFFKRRIGAGITGTSALRQLEQESNRSN